MGKLFRVFETNDYGKATRYFGSFNAETKKEARKLASKIYQNEEISKTGYFDAEEVTIEKLQFERRELQMLMDSKTNIIVTK